MSPDVAGRKRILTPCWKPFLWLAFCFSCYYNHTQWLAWRTLPFCLTVKHLCSAQADSLALPTCEYKRLTHPLQRLATVLEMFCKTEGAFTLLPNCLSLSILPFDFSSSLLLSLWSIKEPGINTLTRGLFWGTSLPSSQSPGSQIKSLASTPRLSDSLACHEASRVSLDSVTLTLSNVP